jgi:hypothetical protein
VTSWVQARAAAEEPALRLSASLREGTHWLGLLLLYHLTHFLAVTGDQLLPQPLAGPGARLRGSYQIISG